MTYNSVFCSILIAFTLSACATGPYNGTKVIKLSEIEKEIIIDTCDFIESGEVDQMEDLESNCRETRFNEQLEAKIMANDRKHEVFLSFTDGVTQLLADGILMGLDFRLNKESSDTDEFYIENEVIKD
ncbi:MAG: hypothetical protein ABJN69_09745 [Hellea sp.]